MSFLSCTSRVMGSPWRREESALSEPALRTQHWRPEIEVPFRGPETEVPWWARSMGYRKGQKNYEVLRVLWWFMNVYDGLSCFYMLLWWVLDVLWWRIMFLWWCLMFYAGVSCFYDGAWCFMMAYHALWWCMMLYAGLWWCMMMYDGFSWFIMVYDDVWWFIMDTCGLWFIIWYHGIHGLSVLSWIFMVCHCLPWFMQFMMFHIVEVVWWCIVVYPG